jgi:hypothetical protein
MLHESRVIIIYLRYRLSIFPSRQRTTLCCNDQKAALAETIRFLLIDIHFINLGLQI